MSQNITIAKLNTLVTANAAQFTAEMNKASDVAKSRGEMISRTFRSIRSSLDEGFGKLAAVASIGGVIEFGAHIVELGAKIKDLSEEAGMSTKAFQVISAAAARHGVDMEQVAKATEHLRSGLQAAVEKGSDPMNASLAKLNLTAAGLKNLAPEEQWEVIGRRLAEATDKQAALNVIFDAFGEKIGPKMRKTLEEIAGGYKELEKSTPVFSEAQLDRLERAHATWEKTKGYTSVISMTGVENLFDNPVGKIGEVSANLGASISEKIQHLERGFLPPIRDPNSFTNISARENELNQKMKESEQEENSRRLAELFMPKFGTLHDRFEPYSIKAMRSALMTPEELQKKMLSGKPYSMDVPTDSLSRIGLMTGALKSNRDQLGEQRNRKLDKISALLEQILRQGRGDGEAVFGN